VVKKLASNFTVAAFTGALLCATVATTPAAADSPLAQKAPQKTKPAATPVKTGGTPKPASDGTIKNARGKKGHAGDTGTTPPPK
jgi:hypothetical protein